MATATTKQSTFTERLDWALEHSGLSRRQAENMLKLAKGRLAYPIQKAIEPELCVRLADLLQFDPRWLSLGVPSPAGEAAAAVAEREMRAKKRITPEDRKSIVELLSRLEEPSHAGGVCRYCGCTDEAGCGDCRWLDAAATICSACLEEAA